MRSKILFASFVGIGAGRESTEGGGDTSDEVGREIRLVNRRVEGFRSLDGGTGDEMGGREGPEDDELTLSACPSTQDSSVVPWAPGVEKDPIRFLISEDWAAEACCRRVPSMVCVLGRNVTDRDDGLDEDEPIEYPSSK